MAASSFPSIFRLRHTNNLGNRFNANPAFRSLDHRPDLVQDSIPHRTVILTALKHVAKYPDNLVGEQLPWKQMPQGGKPPLAEQSPVSPIHPRQWPSCDCTQNSKGDAGRLAPGPGAGEHDSGVVAPGHPDVMLQKVRYVFERARPLLDQGQPAVCLMLWLFLSLHFDRFTELAQQDFLLITTNVQTITRLYLQINSELIQLKRSQ